MLQRYFAPVFRAACGIALGAAVAQAQTIPPGCQAPIEARKKLFVTPHHTYVTEAAASTTTPARTNESISTADATYIQVKGAWKKSPVTPQQMLKQLDENLLDAKGMACRQLGDEAVDGTSASVYSAHSQTSEATSDAKMWIAKGTGLVLKEEEDMSEGTRKQHMSIRYDYKNVRAPAGVQ